MISRDIATDRESHEHFHARMARLGATFEGPDISKMNSVLAQGIPPDMRFPREIVSIISEYWLDLELPTAAKNMLVADLRRPYVDQCERHFPWSLETIWLVYVSTFCVLRVFHSEDSRDLRYILFLSASLEQFLRFSQVAMESWNMKSHPLYKTWNASRVLAMPMAIFLWVLLYMGERVAIVAFCFPLVRRDFCCFLLFFLQFLQLFGYGQWYTARLWWNYSGTIQN